jgi:hypothetical protein
MMTLCVGLPLCCVQVHNQSQSISVTSVAMRFTEEFLPATHQQSLGLVVVFDRFVSGGYVGYALTTAWDEGDGCVAAAATAAGADAADPGHDDDSRPHSTTATAAADSKVRALQVGSAGPLV